MRNFILFGLFFFFVLCTTAKTFLFIGDSITDGNWGNPSKYPCNSEERNLWDKNHILGHGYVEMIAGYYGGEYPDSDYNFINRGISGETLSQIALRWDKDVINNHPDEITLLCGTNDVHYWLETNPEGIGEFDFHAYMSVLDSIINITIKKFPDIRINLATPFAAKAGKIKNHPNINLRIATVDSIATLIKEYINTTNNQNIFLIDFNHLLNELKEDNSNIDYWMWDGIHPTTPMHYRMAKYYIQNHLPIKNTGR